MIYDRAKETKSFLCSLCVLVLEFLMWTVAEGCIVACLDVLQLTHAAVATV